ncbi:plasmid stability protein stbC [Achromobacter aloeverae]|uniref:plasmid stability protein stbC n=1 Tax=Achromobacter aloeverae TaxID=1750518 RepID=UPI00195D2F36|nr:plasmid stability protein stbC [Achromobacter aloeverae]
MHDQTTEAEDSSILEQAPRPEGGLKLGLLLAFIAREAGGLTDAEAETINELRGKTPAEPMSFE